MLFPLRQLHYPCRLKAGEDDVPIRYECTRDESIEALICQAVLSAETGRARRSDIAGDVGADDTVHVDAAHELRVVLGVVEAVKPAE